jgi:hypothetical protein
MNRTITHKNLKRQFDIFEQTEEIDDLFLELEFSTLLLPIDIDKDELVFPLIMFGDKNYVPVFTDVHEFKKLYSDGKYSLVPYDFNFYLDLLDEDIDGIVIDVQGERFPLTREFKEFLKPNHVFDYDPQPFTASEIRKIRENVSNVELEEFISDESNYWDFEKLMEILLMSDIFTVGLSKKDLSDEAEEGVIPVCPDETLPLAITSRYSESYALIYSSESEIRKKNSPYYPYSQIVNIPEMIRRVLLDDLDGIILNENSQSITIPRQFLLNFLHDFSCPNIDKYDSYAFILEENHDH